MKKILIPGILAGVLIMAFGFAIFPADYAKTTEASEATHADLIHIYILNQLQLEAKLDFICTESGINKTPGKCFAESP